MPFPLLAPIIGGAATAAGGYLANKGLNYLFDGSSSAPSTASRGSFLGGQPGRFEQVPRYTQQQERAFNEILKQATQGLQNPMAGFEPFAQQARKQFQEQTVPSLAERFTGTGGALSSPAFASQLGSAGSQLESNLAALGSQYGLQNQQRLLDMLRFGVTPQYDTYQMAGQPGFLESAAPSLLKILPLLARLTAEYKTQGMSQGESPFWELLLSALGGSALPKAGE